MSEGLLADDGSDEAGDAAEFNLMR